MSISFLHVGMHKTGSTAIQSAFSGFDDGRKQYAELGYENHSIPFFTAFSESRLDYHIWKSARLTAREIELKRDECLKNIKSVISRYNDRQLIFSGEDISLLSESSLKQISEIFKNHGRSVKVIIYLREPISFIKSNYQEEIKSGRNFTSPSPPRYKFRIEKFIQTFSAENVVVRVFDRDLLHENDIVKDFSRLVGVVPPAAPKDNNATLSTEAVKTIYLLNKMVSGIGEAKDFASARQRMLEHIRTLLPGKFDVPSSILTGLIDHEDVDWLYSATGIDFRQIDREYEPFSQERLDSYFSNLQDVTIGRIREYLLNVCKLDSAPDDTHFLLARYFMSFLPTGWPSEFRFDPDQYLELHPDVKKARVDPYRHYLEYGIFEGRRIK